MSKSLWIHKPIGEGIRSELLDYGLSHNDFCCICTKKLTELCKTCNILCLGEVENVWDIKPLKKVWETLLMMKNRRSTVFSILDKYAIGNIYKYVVQTFDIPIQQKCQIVQLECLHHYHRHCFASWVKRRMVCPLDNSKEIMPIGVTDVNRRFIVADFKGIMTKDRVSSE